MILRYMILIHVILIGMLYANSVDSMLDEYSKKNSLSQKTIDENKGHLVLFTRDKLEKMHAKTLKDVFKTTPAIYYHENRIGIPDPLTGAPFQPYNSSFIRLYIDGVEITQGWMGSGIMLYGDVNIDFVDHIEFYYMIPSFENSVEPAYLTVFLYSKDAKRDSGGKVNLTQGSRGYNAQTVSYGSHEKDFSYMMNLSHTNAKREKIDNGTSTPLSRDFQRTQLFSYIKNEKQIFHLQVLSKKTDGLAGMSFDATPLESEINYLTVHMDYGVDISEHWHTQFAYDWLKVNMFQLDDFSLAWADAGGSNSFDGIYKNSTYTGELTYTNTLGENHITAGIKGRGKKLDSFTNKGVDALTSPFTSEEIASIFFQDQYALSQNRLLTIGISYNYISRNGGVVDDSLLQLRLGYLYSNETWSYKTYLFRTQIALEPFTRYTNPLTSKDITAQTTMGMTHEVAYLSQKYHIRFLLNLMKDEDSLLASTLSNIASDTTYFTSIFNYDYYFDSDNKLNVQFYYGYYKDIFDLDVLKDVSGYFSLQNSYGNFDFYNGVVWHSNSIDWVNYFDLTSSISWNISKNASLILKGDNILNKAKKTDVFRVDPTTGSLLSPLGISPIDQRFTIELEYLF